MEKGKRKVVSAGVTAILFTVPHILSLSAMPVAAQEKQTRQDVDLSAIIVTAQKQEENVQEVPLSISVINELDIEDRKIESVRDIADFVPNLMNFHHGTTALNTPTMRGVVASAESLDTSVGLFVDGVPVLMTPGFEASMLDVERIEILRGPQGTLYGKGAEAGVINIITRQPNNEFRGKLSAEGGKLLSMETGDGLAGVLSLNLSGPIMEDKFYFGISGRYFQRDGFIENTMTDNTVDDREHWFGKAHLRWTPTDKFDISLIASHLGLNDGGLAFNLGEDAAAMFGLPTPEDRKVSSNLEGKNDSEVDLQSLKVAHDINESLILTSITAHWLNKKNMPQDYDFSFLPLMNAVRSYQEFDKVSQELRLDYSAGRLRWLVGLYYDKADNDFDSEQTSMIPTLNGVRKMNIKGDSYAVFSNITYPIAEKLNLTAGLRYENEEKDFKNHISNLKMNDSWNSLTPKIALQYLFTPKNMTYINASKGYRSGGFNWAAQNFGENATYDQEELWSYEIGAKNSFFDNRLVLNGSVFYMDITDMQVEETTSPTTTVRTNAAEATAKGFELEISARISDSLSLMAGYGYTDIEFDKFSDLAGDYKGNKNPFAPDYTFNIGAQYRHSSGFFARMDLIGYGKMYLDKANKYSRDAYEIVNAKIGYEMENFDIYIYGKNIFDKEYNSYGAWGGYYTVYSDPGEIGLQLTYRF